MDIVCLRNISINTLHKGDDDYDDDDNNSNNNNKTFLKVDSRHCRGFSFSKSLSAYVALHLYIKVLFFFFF